MRVFVSCDMEGATGVVHRDQLMPGGYDYQRARELFTGDVVAVVEAALAFDGVELVRVCDGHGTMRNILIERMPANCELVTGPASSRELCQMEGIDDSFDAAIFVGYHARAGTPNAVLPHTWVGSVVREVRVNGDVFGETALNAGIAGAHGMPVVCVTGDVAVCAEAKALLGDSLSTVAVKRAVGPASAICQSPVDTEVAIRLGVLRALEDVAERSPLTFDGPVRVAISFHRQAQADRANKRPGAERTGPCELSFERPTYLAAAREAWALIEWTANEHPEWLR